MQEKEQPPKPVPEGEERKEKKAESKAEELEERKETSEDTTKKEEPQENPKKVFEDMKEMIALMKQHYEGLSSAAQGAIGGVDSLGKQAYAAAEKIVLMNAAFDRLIKKIDDGVIKKFGDLETAVDSLTGTLIETRKEINRVSDQIKKVLDTPLEESETIQALQRSQAQKIYAEFTLKFDQFSENLQELAKAVAKKYVGSPEISPDEMQSMMGDGRGRVLLRKEEIPPKGAKSEDENGWRKFVREQKGRVDAAISAVEEQDKAFGESWRDTWPIETMLATLYEVATERDDRELLELQRELRREYENRRRVHDYFWYYQRCSGIEAILNMSAVINKTAIEEVVRLPGVGEGMLDLQELLMNWHAVKEDLARGPKKNPKEKEEAEKRMSGISEKIKHFSKGLDTDTGKTIDVKDARTQRLAARMMVILGFTAQYGNTDIASSGDFFIGRILNLKDFMGGTRPGGRWQYRQKLIDGFKQDLFFSGPLADNWKADDEEKLKSGIIVEEVPVYEYDNHGEKREIEKRKIVRIVRPGEEVKIKTRQRDEHGELIIGTNKRATETEQTFVFSRDQVLNMLGSFEIRKENRDYWLGGAQFADQAFKADEGRKRFRNTGQLLDRPTRENFIKLMSEDLQHLSGEERWKFMASLTEGFVNFYQEEGGVISRLIQGKPLRTEYRIKDPETGKEVRYKSFTSSDSERAGVGQAWTSMEIDAFISAVQGTDLLDSAYGEWLKRKKLGLLGIGGIGPVRGAREIFDQIKKNWLWALLAMFMETFKASLPEELGMEGGGKKRR